MFLEFQKEIFKNHPYQYDLMGEVALVERMTLKETLQLLDLHRQTLPLHVSVTGSISDLDYLVKCLEALPQQVTEFQHWDHKLTSLEEDSIIHVPKDKQQTHILFGYKGLTFGDKRRYSLDVMQSVLSGQGGRLFMELRDKNSLAYTVAPYRMEGVDPGFLELILHALQRSKRRPLL